MTDLATRLEQGTAEQQQELLEEAWDTIAPLRGIAWASVNAGRFGRMIDAEAYESAALTLVPEGEGRWPQVYYVGPNPNDQRYGHRWSVWEKGKIEPHKGHNKDSSALALAAAALRARENSHD